MRRLERRVAVVTGGGAGIGEAICHRLACEGARVAALDISLPAAQRTIAAIGDGLAVPADVSDSAAVDAAFALAERELGPVDILVNNAGAVGLDHVRRVTPLLERQHAEIAADGRARTPLDALVRLGDSEWRRLLAVHLDGTFYCTRAAVRSMAARGTGVIINMASVCGIEGCTGHPHYSAAKAGILGFTRSAAKELIVQGIRVNAVAPGFVDTSRLKPDLDTGRQAAVARTPAGRLGTPAEIAAAVAFLAGDEAAFFVGATLSPNGGLLTALPPSSGPRPSGMPAREAGFGRAPRGRAEPRECRVSPR
jgi:3-oxoacyl-[acyl-carrier protein] reductase